MRLTGGLSGLAVLVVLGCGGGGTEPDAPPRPSGNTPPPPGGITVLNDQFTPSLRVIAPGGTIQWAWNTCSGSGGYGGGETCVAHNVTFDDGPASPTQETGSYSRTFAAAATYNYRCTVHPTFMTGAIKVE